MTAPFTAAWWLPGPHLPTIWGKFARRGANLPLHVERRDTPDGDFIDIVRLPAPLAHAPRILMLHGLEGGRGSHYVHGMFAAAAKRGWGMDLLLFRGCGSEPNRAPRFYHSGDTEDVAFVLTQLATEAPAAPLLLLGVSLGGNVALKHLGETGDGDSPVRAAAAISVPFSLARGSRHISTGFSRLYERRFLNSLKRKARAKLEHFPDLFSASRMENARSLWEFDDVVTAPVHGFHSASDYYERSSSLGYLHRISLPTLLLSAVDDPFLPPPVLDEVRAIARDNAALEVEFTERGGHVGFVGGAVPWRATYYAESRVMDFLAGSLAKNGIAQRERAAMRQFDQPEILP